MEVKNIIFIFILFYLQLINSNEIPNQFWTKEEVLKMKNDYYVSYYCKDDICVATPYDYSKEFIEIPDKNGNVKKYITYTCLYDNIISGKCQFLHNDTIFQCSNDSECLSNKCFDSYCMFNDETPIVHCDDIYSRPLFLGSRSYMHCGKAAYDRCTKNNECSSKICSSDGICAEQNNGPSERDNLQTGFEMLIISFIILIIFTIGCIYCCRYIKPKIKS